MDGRGHAGAARAGCEQREDKCRALGMRPSGTSLLPDGLVASTPVRAARRSVLTHKSSPVSGVRRNDSPGVTCGFRLSRASRAEPGRTQVQASDVRRATPGAAIWHDCLLRIILLHEAARAASGYVMSGVIV